MMPWRRWIHGRGSQYPGWQPKECDMAYDVKKEDKELYAPKKGPSIVEVPSI